MLFGCNTMLRRMTDDGLDFFVLPFLLPTTGHEVFKSSLKLVSFSSSDLDDECVLCRDMPVIQNKKCLMAKMHLEHSPQYDHN